MHSCCQGGVLLHNVIKVQLQLHNIYYNYINYKLHNYIYNCT